MKLSKVVQIFESLERDYYELSRITSFLYFAFQDFIFQKTLTGILMFYKNTPHMAIIYTHVKVRQDSKSYLLRITI